ncbi:MAG: hypothetical protein U0R76_05680 [Candidatus Nanopelagicales bacterium]
MPALIAAAAGQPDREEHGQTDDPAEQGSPEDAERVGHEAVGHDEQTQEDRHSDQHDDPVTGLPQQPDVGAAHLARSAP